MVHSPPDASPAAMSHPSALAGLASPRSVLSALPCPSGWEGEQCVSGEKTPLRFSRVPICSRSSNPGPGGGGTCIHDFGKMPLSHRQGSSSTPRAACPS
eukprot:7564931-Pyramimonas_sp.AAC.1